MKFTDDFINKHKEALHILESGHERIKTMSYTPGMDEKEANFLQGLRKNYKETRFAVETIIEKLEGKQ